MTHEEIRAGLMDALDGSLDPHVIDEVERHVVDCSECQLEQVELHRMRRAIDRVDRMDPAREAPAPPRRALIGRIRMEGWVRLALLAATVLIFGSMFNRIRVAASPSPSAVAGGGGDEESEIVTVEMRP